MFPVLFTAVLLVVGISGAVKAGINEADFLRARRRGVELQADVVDNDATPVGNRDAYALTPVVRYHLDGRAYTAAVRNASGTPGSRGSAMTIVVHPDHPYDPYDRYAGMGKASRNLLALFALTVGVFVLVLATR